MGPMGSVLYVVYLLLLLLLDEHVPLGVEVGELDLVEHQVLGYAVVAEQAMEAVVIAAVHLLQHIVSLGVVLLLELLAHGADVEECGVTAIEELHLLLLLLSVLLTKGESLLLRRRLLHTHIAGLLLDDNGTCILCG